MQALSWTEMLKGLFFGNRAALVRINCSGGHFCNDGTVYVSILLVDAPLTVRPFVLRL